MKNKIKKDMEVTARVRIKDFSSVYVLKEHTFTVTELDDKYVYGTSIIDGSKAIFPFDQITKIEGMDVERFMESEKG